MTPEQQASLRTSLAKDRKGKKGRPRKQDAEKTRKTNGDNQKKKKDTNKTKPSKVSKTPLKRQRSKGGKTADPKGPAPPKKSLSVGKSDDSSATYGCSRCRYAAKGCKTCKNPNFKPRSRRAAVDVD